MRHLTRSGDAPGVSGWQPICDRIVLRGLLHADWDNYRLSPDGRSAERLVYNTRARDVMDEQAAY